MTMTAASTLEVGPVLRQPHAQYRWVRVQRADIGKRVVVCHRDGLDRAFSSCVLCCVDDVVRNCVGNSA